MVEKGLRSTVIAAKLGRVYCVSCNVNYCKFLFVYLEGIVIRLLVVRYCSSEILCVDVKVLVCKMCGVRIIP